MPSCAQKDPDHPPAAPIALAQLVRDDACRIHPIDRAPERPVGDASSGTYCESGIETVEPGHYERYGLEVWMSNADLHDTCYFGPFGIEGTIVANPVPWRIYWHLAEVDLNQEERYTGIGEPEMRFCTTGDCDLSAPSGALTSTEGRMITVVFWSDLEARLLYIALIAFGGRNWLDATVGR